MYIYSIWKMKKTWCDGIPMRPIWFTARIMNTTTQWVAELVVRAGVCGQLKYTFFSSLNLFLRLWFNFSIGFEGLVYQVPSVQVHSFVSLIRQSCRPWTWIIMLWFDATIFAAGEWNKWNWAIIFLHFVPRCQLFVRLCLVCLFSNNVEP